MRRTFGTLLLILAAGSLPAQNPGKATTSPTSTPSDADGVFVPAAQSGAAAFPQSGTTTPSTGGALPSTQTSSPVVIREGGVSVAAGASSAASGTAASASANPVSPAPPQNDFQQFVHDTLGHDLPIFGSSLFTGGGGTFAQASGAVPPADYTIGTGDQIIIRTWGKVDIDVRPTVDRNGQIFVPRIGMLTIAGLRLDRLTDFIHNAISQQFTGFELSVSLGQLRSIQVFVLGNARAPGVYTISSFSTLINAVFASGGPSSTGTLRDIQLKRDGQVIAHFDVYRLLLEGDKSADTRLLPGDILFVPPLGPQVAVDGDVGTPAIYEIKAGENVGSVLGYAGGLTPVAETARAVLEHVLDHSRRTVEDLSLDAKGLAIPLQSADILRVFPISPKITDAVTLRGNVAQPGRYAWHAGMRVSDIIPSREFLLTRAYYNRQNALDVNGGTHPFSATPGTDTPATATHDTEINWNYAVIERLDPTDLTTRIVPFALGEALASPASPDNKPLNAGDVIVIYSRNDVALPLELQAKFVRIDGQVKAPGVYRVGTDETLRDLVARAGGLVPHAYLYAAQLTRDSVRAEQTARLKTLIAQESREILSPANQREGLAGGTADIELRRAYIAELSKIQPDGRVVLRVPANAGSVADVPAVPLEDGDHFFVPTIPNTVDVLGSVYNPAALSFTMGGRTDTYLNLAGGATREGDRKREFILRANGTLVSRQNASGFGHLLMNPGDALIVPPKLKAGFSLLGAIDLTQLTSTLVLSAVAIRGLQ